MRPLNFAVDDRGTSLSENDRSLGSLELQQIAAMVAGFGGNQHAVDSAPGNCNNCWLEQRALLGNQVRVPTCLSCHSEKRA